MEKITFIPSRRYERKIYVGYKFDNPLLPKYPLVAYANNGTWHVCDYRSGMSIPASNWEAQQTRKTAIANALEVLTKHIKKEGKRKFITMLKNLEQLN